MSRLEKRIRLYYQKLGGHIHCRVFTSNGIGDTFAKVGNLIFSEEEWPAIRRQLEKIMDVSLEERAKPRYEEDSLP